MIETTSYIDPQFVGGHHLVYLPKYTAPDSPLQKMTDEEVKDLWLTQLELMFPQFDRQVDSLLLGTARPLCGAIASVEWNRP